MCLLYLIMLIIFAIPSWLLTAIVVMIFGELLNFTVTAGLITAVWLALWLFKILF